VVRSLQPSERVQEIAGKLASDSGARLAVTADLLAAVAEADYLCTDVWLAMGEPEAHWDERIDLLLPYRVNLGVIAATANPAVKFMHCLPALHNRHTEIGRRLYDRRSLTARARPG
jgi:ornithine carbamoyltransferase